MIQVLMLASSSKTAVSLFLGGPQQHLNEEALPTSAAKIILVRICPHVELRGEIIEPVNEFSDSVSFIHRILRLPITKGIVLKSALARVAHDQGSAFQTMSSYQKRDLFKAFEGGDEKQKRKKGDISRKQDAILSLLLKHAQVPGLNSECAIITIAVASQWQGEVDRHLIELMDGTSVLVKYSELQDRASFQTACRMDGCLGDAQAILGGCCSPLCEYFLNKDLSTEETSNLIDEYRQRVLDERDVRKSDAQYGGMDPSGFALEINMAHLSTKRQAFILNIAHVA